MLIRCPECGKEISDRAASCPNCGCPVSQPTDGIPPKTEPEKKTGGKWALFLIIGIVIVCVLIATTSVNGRSVFQREYTEDDYKATCYSLAVEQVKNYLKAPGTARFCPMREVDFHAVGESTYTMSGWADAENSFGADLRTIWGIMVAVDGDQMKLEMLTIDGETVYP